MFNKKISSLLSGLFLSGILLLSSCKKDDSWRPEPSLSGSTTSITMNAFSHNSGGTDYVLELLSSTKWTATSSEPWLKLPRPNGANDGFLLIKADTNFSKERNAKITVTGNGVEPFVVDVKQNSAIISSMSSDHDITQIPFSAVQVPLYVTNSVCQDITISASEPWVTFKTSGAGSAKPTVSSNFLNFSVYIQFPENTGSTNRTSMITIKNKNGEVLQTYSMTQLTDTFSPLFTGVNWKLKRVTSYSGAIPTNKAIAPCFLDNTTRFTKSSTSSGSFSRDNGLGSAPCDEFEQTSTGTYSIVYGGTYTSITSSFNYNYDSEDLFYLEKLTSDSLKLKSSTSLSNYIRYEFQKAQ